MKADANDSTLRILVVDDCPDNAGMLAILLARLGYRTRTTCNAVSVIHVAGEFKPHVALLDIAMPEKDGYSLAKEFRLSVDLAAIRLIAISGYADDAHRILAAESGFDAYIVKPYTISVLSETIERIKPNQAQARNR